MPRTLRDLGAPRPVIRAWDMPGLRIQEAVYPPLYRMPPHVDGRARVSLLIAGSVEECAGGVSHLSGPGSAVLKPADAVHADRFGPTGARIVTLEASTALMEELSRAPIGRSCYRWRHGAPVALAASVGRTLAGHAPSAGDVLDCLAVVATFVGAGRVHVPRPPQWLETSRLRLHAQPDQPPKVHALAAQAGVHPVYLARAFRRYFSCTIGEYVRRLRVLNAAEWLAASDRPLVEIALLAGFTDQAHFCHAFRRETGMTPNSYRLAHRRSQVSFLQDQIPSLA